MSTPEITHAPLPAIHCPVYYIVKQPFMVFRTATPGSIAYTGISTMTDRCAVCPDGIAPSDPIGITLECGHNVHKKCIVDWFSRTPTQQNPIANSGCPTCGTKVVESTCACGCMKSRH